MRRTLAPVLLLALAACTTDDRPAGPTPQTSAPAWSTTAAAPTSAAMPQPQHGLLGRLAADPAVVREMLLREPRGTVLCGIDILGRRDGERYAWLVCGDYRTGADARELSASALAAVIRHGRVVFPRQAHLNEDIARLFPPRIAHAIRYGDVHPAPTDEQLLELARSIAAAGSAAPSR